jgi:hypothetical protein
MATALPTKERSFVFTNIFPASSLSLADYPTITILLSAPPDNQTIILSCFVNPDQQHSRENYYLNNSNKAEES